MKTPGNLGGSTGRGNGNQNFSGSDNPRHQRAIQALLTRSRPRKQLDREAGCSNGPDLVAELRRRGLEIPCVRVPVIDRDGETVNRGVYHLTEGDRRKIRKWLRARRGGGRNAA